MKKGIVLTMILCLLMIGFLFAQEEEEIEEIIEQKMEQVDEALERVDMEIEKIDENMDQNTEKTYIYFPKQSSDDVKMGVFLSNLDFQDAYEMHYNYNYGVLVTGVTKNGPANKAGIMKGDIIMELNGEKVRYEDHLVRLIKQNSEGSEGKVKFFRDQKIYETNIVFFKLQSEKGSIDIKTKEIKKHMNVGFGGGSWYPIWYTPDIAEFNGVLEDLGFKDEPLSEDGFLIQGGGGMITVGKGWFIGGMGAGYKNKETTKHNWVHYTNGVLDTSLVSRKAKYFVNFGGVTLDKRFHMFKNMTGSLGFMLGWGQQGMKITQSDNNGEITNIDFDGDISDQLDEFYEYNSKLYMHKDYILFQPKATFLYNILDWLALRTEVGYMIGYSSQGWKAERNGEKIKIENAPEVSMDGLTISIGPWFGF